MQGGEGLVLGDGEIRSLYRVLKTHEGELDEDGTNLVKRIEKYLFERLTIEELEGLQRKRSGEQGA